MSLRKYYSKIEKQILEMGKCCFLKKVIKNYNHFDSICAIIFSKISPQNPLKPATILVFAWTFKQLTNGWFLEEPGQLAWKPLEGGKCVLY